MMATGGRAKQEGHKGLAGRSACMACPLAPLNARGPADTACSGGGGVGVGGHGLGASRAGSGGVGVAALPVDPADLVGGFDADAHVGEELELGLPLAALNRDPLGHDLGVGLRVAGLLERRVEPLRVDALVALILVRGAVEMHELVGDVDDDVLDALLGERSDTEAAARAGVADEGSRAARKRIRVVGTERRRMGFDCNSGPEVTGGRTPWKAGTTKTWKPVAEVGLLARFSHHVTMRSA